MVLSKVAGAGLPAMLGDFLEFVRHALLECGREMLVLDRGKRRQVVGQSAFGQKRIGHGRWGGFSRRHIDAQQDSEGERRQGGTEGQ